MARPIQTSDVPNSGGRPFCLALCAALAAALICHQVAGAPQASTQTEPQLELKLVQVVYRHGNRTPEYAYPTDPNANNTFYPFGWDSLDAGGRARAYNLGLYLKNIYGQFVGDQYIPGVVNISSTDIHRTKMCAQLVAAAFFPPVNNQKWGANGGVGEFWQPISFNYVPLYEDDWMYMNKIPCPVYEEEWKNFLEGPVNAAWLASDQELVDAVVKNAQLEGTLANIEWLHQTLRIEAFNNLIIPDWAKPFYPDRFYPFGVRHFHSKVFTRTMQRFYGGPLLGHILETMRNKVSGSPLKMWLYSAHDDTVTRLGYAMRVWKNFYPDFSSALIIELHADPSGNHFVKTFFHNDTSKPPMQVNVEGCADLCRLEDFGSILKDSIPVNRPEECLGRSGASSVREKYFPISILLTALLLGYLL